MKSFYNILINTLFVSVTNFFLWFALTFWLYLETKSVLTTSFLGGGYMVIQAFSSFWFGSIVDHHKKKNVLVAATVINFVLFVAAFAFFRLSPEGSFSSVANPSVWILAFTLLAGTIASNIRNVALPTLVSILVPADRRDKANGLTGMVMGLSSFGAGLSSGFALAYLGMGWVIGIATVLIGLSLIHLLFVKVPEKEIVHLEGDAAPKAIDVKGTIEAIKFVPGLFALIFFTTFNNLIGGVFMSLMDAYGLSLVSVQVWSTLWAFLSFGFIFGGIYISKKGLGTNPLRRLFIINLINWTVCMFFTIQPSIVLMAAGILIWTSLAPFIEATEQTIIQKVVPVERQGRVFGFAQSVEMGAMPLSAFVIGPIAQYIFIPFMTTGAGVHLIGDWFGTGPGRGIALVFILASFVGLTVTLIAMRSKSYKLLAKRYKEASAQPATQA